MLATSLALYAIVQIPAPPHGSLPEGELAARVAEILLREEAPDESSAHALRTELMALGELEAPLLGLLADWQTPSGGGGAGQRLNEAQRALVLDLVAELPRAGWKELRAAVPLAEEPAQLRAGLRLEGALAKAGSVRPLFSLAQRAQELGIYVSVSEAFEEALAHMLAREPKAIDMLRSAWSELDPLLAVSVVHALEVSPSRAAVECLWSWLGRRDELEAPVLLALGNLHPWVEHERHSQLQLDVQARLTGREASVIQAAATTLGRIGSPDTLPWLIELLVHEDPAVQRAALGALRNIGGVRLPGSTTAWRSWYAREETWFQERAPALLEELVAAEEGEDLVNVTRTLLRSLTEHRLHRDELAEYIEPLLAHERPRLRILACQAFERLASRRALPWLVSALRDEDPGVVSAAHAALRTLEGVTLGTDPEPWCARLGLPLPAARP